MGGRITLLIEGYFSLLQILIALFLAIMVVLVFGNVVRRRILARAGLPHIGTHGIRHRSATDTANSGIPVKVGMVLTTHKTVTMFMKYVHTEDDPVRAAAEAVNQRRQASRRCAPCGSSMA